MVDIDKIQNSLLKLEEWVSKRDYRAYDTFDGLSSPFSGLFTLGHPFLRRLWQQGVRRFPLNIRPLLGIKVSQGSKAMGFFAQGYLRLYQTTGQDVYRAKMRSCLNWLIQHRCPEFKGNAWGNHFDYESRGGRIPCGTPTVVWSSLIGHAFLDAYDAFSSEQDLAVAVGVAEFISKELGWIETGKDICLNYTPANDGKGVPGEHGIHNSNVLGAGLLARVHSHLPNPFYTEIAERAVQFTVRDQMPNGAWNYGSHPCWRWVDSFHTAYNLESIDYYIRGTGDQKFQPALANGYKFYIDTFFGEDGTPRYYDYKTRPLDIQCASQGIQTLVNLRELDSRSIATAEKVALWTIDNMQDPTGYFYYRKYPVVTNKTPTLHWGQATMFAAMALLVQHMQNLRINPPAKGGRPRSQQSV